jgi:hypothetical protein
MKSGAKKSPAPSDPPDADKSVFINCPFDPEFQPLFDAVILATVACGFIPRSAMESGTVSDSRIDRIRQAMFSSRYSIHDLSRCQGQGDANLARFNMPLELGFAMSRRFLAKADQDAHDWLVLVPQGHAYLQFISDLGAFDPKIHNGSVETVVPPVVNWLKTRPHATVSPFPDRILARLPGFLAAMKKLRARSGGELPWSETMLAAKKHARLPPRHVNVT